MTSYEQEVQNLKTPSFDAIRKIAINKLKANFRDEEINAMHDELERGTSIILREELLWHYLYSFGKKHQAKIHAALNKMQKLTEIVCSEYSIIDWGCGQGLATVCMFDYLNKQNISNAIKRIILIEPSELALKYAVLNTRKYGVEEIILVNKCLDDVAVEDIKTDTPVTIHLFSNILDVEGFSLKKLAQTIGASASGEHYFICVSPIYSNDHRIEAFYKYFAESETIEYIEESGNKIAVLANEQHAKTVEENYTLKLLIFKYISGKSYVIEIEYYPPVQFFAGAELDCVRKERRSFSEEYNMRWSNMMAFEVAAPFDLGARVYDDVHPILAVLNNIITRGLPTRTSPHIEDVFSCYGNSLIDDKLGRVEYTGELYSNEQVKMAQYYSPIGVARIQKTVIEALMAGVLSTEKESWDVLVRERDVPCAAMAFLDLKQMFGHIVSLSKNYQAMELPEVRLTIICGDGWVDSPLHLGMQAQAKISEPVRSATYDIVVDVSVSSNMDDGVDPFSEFKSKNDCYFTIRSAKEVTSKRYIYTSDTIDYLSLGTKDRFGDFKESENIKEHLMYFLKLLFRKEDFRPGQIPILDRALQNKNVIGLLPTGGGKSLIYQFAAMLQPGVTIVVDPLRSLMKDQYDGLLNMGIDTCSFINSTLDAKERGRREKQMESSEFQFVFLSPERLCIYTFREKLKTMHDMHVYFSYGVIDEVHCVSEWGHDFRFSYLHLGRNMYNYVCAKDKSKRLTLFGLTATASFDVLSDVERELSGNGAYPLDAETVVRHENMDRLELQYKVERVPVDYPSDKYYDKNGRLDKGLPIAVDIADKWAAYKSKETILPAYISRISNSIIELQSSNSIERIKAAFKERQNTENFNDAADLTSDIPKDMFAKSDTYEQAGIVFCPHRKNTGVSVGANANALSRGVRDIGTFIGSSDDDQDDAKSFENLDKFRNNELSLMVATKAFGMGIDKPNVRFTVNMNYPSSLESFIQEAGRAGRDGRIALAIILFSDYRLVRISKKYENNDFPVKLLKNKWFKEDDLQSTLAHYGIDIAPDLLEIFTPEHDLVKLTCSKNKKMFGFQECSEGGCDVFAGCNLRTIPNEARGFHYYADLEAVLADAGMKVPQKDLQYLNPDYDTVIYFYNNNFKGDLVEKKAMHSLLSQSVVEVFYGDNAEYKPAQTEIIKNLLTKILSVDVGSEIVAFIPYSDDENAPNNFTDIAKAIYRMCCIDLIDDYTQNYSTHKFRIVITRKPDGAYYDGLKRFLMRYYSEGRASELLEDVPNYKGQNEIHKCLGYLTEFIYSKIAVKRKRAIDDMRLFCIQGLDDSKDWKEVNEDLKDFIYYYFNSKYANDDYVADTGEPFSLTIDTDRGKVSSFGIVEKFMRVIDDDLVGGGGTPIDNLKHLQGAVRLIRRALTDNNAALALLNFFCLVQLGINNNLTLENEIIEDYQKGLLEFADMAESKEEYWRFFESFHTTVWNLPQQYDLSKLMDIKEEIIVKAHLAVLRGLKNRYCE